MRNKRKSRLFLLLSFILLSITIGFAAIATKLKVNGTTNIGKNTWNIYWDNVANQRGVTTATPVISNDSLHGINTAVTWTVTLDKPGDFYEFTVDAVNAGTIDAMITSIEHTLDGIVMSNSNKLPDYVKYSVTYANGDPIAVKHILPKADSTDPSSYKRETFKIRVEFDRNIEKEDLSDEDLSFELSFGLTYGQADPTAINPHPIFTLPQGKAPGTLTAGDEICLNGTTTECFNFIGYSGDDVVMLAKYNLNVGNNTQPGTVGVQNPLATGDKSGAVVVDGKYPATVYFSENKYWYSGDILPEYQLSLDVYKPTYDSAPGNEQYSLAYYIKPYKTLLEGNGYGAVIKEARLLTYDEVTYPNIGCDISTGTCPTDSFILNTSFWLGTVRNTYEENYHYDMIYVIRSFNYFNSSSYGSYNDSYYGVRPVIVVAKTSL